MIFPGEHGGSPRVTVPDAQDLEIETLGEFESLAKILGMEQEGTPWIVVCVSTGIPGEDLGPPAQDQAAGFPITSLRGTGLDARRQPRGNRQGPGDLELDRIRSHFLLSAQS